jgi:hypothetical protein
MLKTMIWDNIELKQKRSLAKKIIFDDKSVWRSHGLGMIQYPIDENYRIHIWDTRLSQFSIEETCHRHTFDMTSDVLWGEVNHIEVIPRNATSFSGVQKFKKVIFEGAENTTVKEQDGLYELSCFDMRIVEGKSYSMPQEAYHQFSIPTLTITIIERRNFRGNSEAFFPVGINPRAGRAEDGFAVDKDLCQQIISDAKNIMLGL